VETHDYVVHFNEDGSERVELAASPEMSILVRLYSGGEEVDAAVDPIEGEEFIRVLTEAIKVARSTP
jgi:hypothetical protein